WLEGSLSPALSLGRGRGRKTTGSYFFELALDRVFVVGFLAFVVLVWGFAVRRRCRALLLLGGIQLLGDGVHRLGQGFVGLLDALDVLGAKGGAEVLHLLFNGGLVLGGQLVGHVLE